MIGSAPGSETGSEVEPALKKVRRTMIRTWIFNAKRGEELKPVN
jgi:hypothetical protein